MVQSVFAHGELVAFHACERVREGAAGGSSHKLGLGLPEAREHMTRLGAALDWHGALSADVILGPDGPRFIDINPRLVEPVNALACGVDLAGALVEVARSVGPVRRTAADGRARGADPSAAARGARRGPAGRAAGRGARAGPCGAAPRDYRGSREELTPGRGDPLAPLPVAATALATLIRPQRGGTSSGAVPARTRSPRPPGSRSARRRATARARARPGRRPRSQVSRR